ncbi:MAG: DUF1028 domain-containing protein [Planctomycetota bacterium]|nr:DUF1028 domain-containing protein [Planctomycetota bacterium]
MLKRLLLPLLVFALVLPARATWSIVVCDTATGEVIVASATCLENFDLQAGLPVVRPGIGGAAAQSMIDSGAVNRKKIWTQLGNGVRPGVILSNLAAVDPWHQARQYGIVNFVDNPAKFTGNGAGGAKKAVTGVVGTLRYSIQGNVLTAKGVIDAAEAALLSSPGDLGQRVMAGMEAARALGGDGRCSCDPIAPMSCGAPPPGFTKSAHIGFLVIARAGDLEGTCDGALGCANGSYYLSKNVVAGAAALDPVLQLQQDYALWRAGLVGRPDHVLSQVAADSSRLPADGLTTTTLTIALVDVDGTPLTTGGAAVHIAGTGLTTLGAVTDLGNGSYEVPVTAGGTSGTESLTITVDDGISPVQLYPDFTVQIDPPIKLHAGESDIVAGGEVDVDFTLDLGPGAAGAVYLLLGSLSGTSPGVQLAGGVLPLNPDALLDFTLLHPGPPLLPGSFGLLDGAGRASAALAAPAGTFSAFVGLHTDWAAVALTTPELVTNAVGLDVLP